jgi:inward rectifier potassium channel
MRRMKIEDPGPKPVFIAQARQMVHQKRVALVKGQDGTQWTDLYHLTLRAPWSLFFLGLAGLFVTVNAIFAMLYMADPHGLLNARPGNFWDAFVFSVQTFGVQTIASIGHSPMAPKSVYVDSIVILEAFTGILYLGTVTAVMFARFSRPSSRVLFSKVAVVAPFNGVPTLQFRAANQRGNQVLDASVRVSLARQSRSTEGIVMRRFDELKLTRARTSLFALSWTIMHPINEDSPLYGADSTMLYDDQMEIIVLLSGTDETLADVIYARHAYGPDDLIWGHRFVDVLSMTPQGQRIVDLHKFHDTEPVAFTSDF